MTRPDDLIAVMRERAARKCVCTACQESRDILAWVDELEKIAEAARRLRAEEWYEYRCGDERCITEGIRSFADALKALGALLDDKEAADD